MKQKLVLALVSTHLFSVFRFHYFPDLLRFTFSFIIIHVICQWFIYDMGDSHL
jgi:hypothetical protein